jgi:hypothetical protein
VLGMVGWLVLWSAYYIIAHAASPRHNLAGAIMLALAATATSPLVILLLLLAKLRWAAFGYAAAMALDGVGLLLVADFSYSGNYVLAFVISLPFFLPTNSGP